MDKSDDSVLRAFGVTSKPSRDKRVLGLFDGESPPTAAGFVGSDLDNPSLSKTEVMHGSLKCFASQGFSLELQPARQLNKPTPVNTRGVEESKTAQRWQGCDCS
jgi:hypothetical protein